MKCRVSFFDLEHRMRRTVAVQAETPEKVADSFMPFRINVRLGTDWGP
jgi:hypothetical protein